MPPTLNSPVLLRQAALSDALCLAVLAMQVYLDTYAKQGIRPAIARDVLASFTESSFSTAIADKQTKLWVAERESHLVGFAQVTVGQRHELAPQGHQAELLRLYVQEPFTGQKIGTWLLKESEATALAAGCDVLWLSPWVHNHRALGFYASHGYRDHGRTDHVIENESHENRVYAKQLSASGTA